MKKTKAKKKKTKPITLIFFISVYLLLAGSSIIDKSPTYDEVIHLADGILFNKTGNFRSGLEHPPLLRFLAGLPSHFVKLEMPDKTEIIRSVGEIEIGNWSVNKDLIFARKLFYDYKNPTGFLFFAGRFTLLLLGIPLILVLSKWSFELYGKNGMLISLILFCLSPNILAHARLITTDFGSVAITFIASYFLWRFAEKPILKNAVISSLFWGAALASKYSVLFYFLAFHLAAFFLCREKRKFISLFFFEIPAIIFLINLCYLFSEPVGRSFFQSQELKYLPHFIRPVFPFLSKYLFLPRMFVKGIVLSFTHSQRGHSAYLLGMHSTKGWWYFYPVALTVKSTFAMIFTGFLALISAKKNKISRDESFFIFPVLIFLLFMMKNRLNIGIRHVLIFFPFFFLFAGRIAKIIPKKFVFVILFFALLENLLIYPHYLSQFNFLLGGAKNGYKYLADSNIDWGQDLKLLSKWWEKEGKPPIIISYFGTAYPPFYGLKFQQCLSNTFPPIKSNAINPPNPRREFFAISETNLVGTYYAQDIFSYFRGEKPFKRIGYSIYVYDVSNDAYAHYLLGAIYRAIGEKTLAEREFARSAKINPFFSIELKKMPIGPPF
ncbi:MAG: glycosyltransferase family 39 protein [Elusimicrobia bacterium]|nr:glycosyltransferase family 39 protein [Elusimicrobiota bacterium]